MNKTKWIILFAGMIILGFLASYLSLVPLLAVITAVIAVVILLLDYEKATLIVALYAVFEFVLRKLISSPLSKILTLFGKRVYFEFIQEAANESTSMLASYWDEAALLLCFGIWFYKWFRHRKETPYRKSPLDISIILFTLFTAVLLFVAAPDFTIGVEGFRVVVQYMLWFFVITQLLRTPQGAKRILNIMILIAFVISLYGVYQFIIGVAIPPRWVDQSEGNVRTRVFSIFTSPNMLAGFLSLIIPIAIGLFMAEKERKKKVYYAGVLFTMGLSLLFTMSRGGWFFCFFSIAVFVFLRNRKLIFPSILAAVALFAFTIIFVPSVSSRILYLFSPQYFISSSKAGRVYRAIEGFRLFAGNFWTGMGLGQFGGSVALSHKLNNTFSMDNYYLKTAVEMGIFGLTAFIALMYSTIAWCSRAISHIRDAAQKDWVRGIVASIAGILLYNLTENMMEIPLISSYFWVIVGIVMFLAYGRHQMEREPAVPPETTDPGTA